MQTESTPYIPVGLIHRWLKYHVLGRIWGFAGGKWLKGSPGATESPHSFQGWGLFSRPARPPASPALWNGSLQGNSTRTSGRRSPSTSLCARSDCMNLFNMEQEAQACLDSLSFHKQFDTSVKVQVFFFRLCLLKTLPGFLTRHKKVLRVNTEEC